MNQERLIVNFWSPAISMSDSFLRLNTANVFIFPGCENDGKHPLKAIICNTKESKPLRILHKAKQFNFVPDSDNFTLSKEPSKLSQNNSAVTAHKSRNYPQQALNVFIAKKANFSIRFRCIENISATVHN